MSRMEFEKKLQYFIAELLKIAVFQYSVLASTLLTGANALVKQLFNYCVSILRQK